MHGTSQAVRLADVGKRQRISQSYLEHLLKKLLQHGFIASFRGPGGGYRLARRLATISVADIIGAVDGETVISPVHEQIDRSSGAVAGVADGLWCRVDDHLLDYLRSVTLESVLANAIDAENLRERSTVVATVPHVERPPLRHEYQPAAMVG
jgi:Rrf2 family iron-sulfur cluster assembly transcriptional regulator